MALLIKDVHKNVEWMIHETPNGKVSERKMFGRHILHAACKLRKKPSEFWLLNSFCFIASYDLSLYICVNYQFSKMLSTFAESVFCERLWEFWVWETQFVLSMNIFWNSFKDHGAWMRSTSATEANMEHGFGL